MNLDFPEIVRELNQSGVKFIKYHDLELHDLLECLVKEELILLTTEFNITIKSSFKVQDQKRVDLFARLAI